MFDVFNSLVETASGTAKKLTDEGYQWVKQTGVLDLEEGFNDEESDVTVKDADTHSENIPTTTTTTTTDDSAVNRNVKGAKLDAVVSKQLLFETPPSWESTVEEWHLLSQAALREENTCIIPPETITGNAELAERLCRLLCVDAVADLPQPPSPHTCGPSRELVEMISSTPTLMAFRSSMVPRYVSDAQYWVNLYWRFHLYHMCGNAMQLLDVMAVVTTEPNPVDPATRRRVKGVGVANSEVQWNQLREEITAQRARTQWIREQEDTVRREMELARSNLQLLTNLLKKKEVSELGNSVCESCKYHKTKLSRIVGELKSQQVRLQGTPLCTDEGHLFLEILDTNEQFRTLIDAYEALLSGKGSESWERISNSEEKNKKSRNDAERDTNCTGHEDETTFEVELPWENDGDDEVVETKVEKQGEC